MTLKIIPVGTVTAEKGHRLQEKTLDDVAKKINQLTEAGSASWSVDYSIPSLENNQIENFIITLSLTMKMPVWANYPNRPEKEKKEWDRFYKALRYHEDQHHELCKRLARMMNQKLLNEKNEKDFKRVFNTEFSKFQTLNDKLDEDSGHGTKQDSPFGPTVININ
jgi:predicted secreted Zn-dependent protease